MAGTWTWATVTQATPLRIKVDGDTTQLNATTDNLVGSLAVDDRVRVHLHSDGIIVTGIQGGGNRSNPNLLINSDFMVNQEGNTSGASVADGAYFLDGWKNATGGTTSLVTWADSGGVRTLTIGATGLFPVIREVVEQQNIQAGTHTLSWQGATTARVYNSGATAPSFATSPVTVTLDGATNGVVDFTGDGQTVANVKLERGSVATPYQPPTYADNLRACMRYFQVLLEGPLGAVVPAFMYNATVMFGLIELIVPMRATPTIVAATGTNHYRFSRNGGHDYMTTLAFDDGDARRVAVVNTTEISGTAGQSGMLRAYAADAKLTADARL